VQTSDRRWGIIYIFKNKYGKSKIKLAMQDNKNKDKICLTLSLKTFKGIFGLLKFEFS
jgi:hypothetical protein